MTDRERRMTDGSTEKVKEKAFFFVTNVLSDNFFHFPSL